jgi:hypothetical protein
MRSEAMTNLRKIRIPSALVVAAAALLAGRAAAADVEAKKDGVEVFADATNKSAVVSTLKSGQSLPAGERKGMFWQVDLGGGKSGFVSVMAVKHKPDTNTDLAKAIKTVVKDGRQDESNEGRARSAVMGVRGLAADDDAGNAGDVRPNLRAVFKMEDTQVTQKKLDQVGDLVMAEIAAKAK